jgi:hypothetical protein
MSEDRVFASPNCLQHSNTVERLAAMEKGLKNTEENVANIHKTLEAIREDITNGIMHRYPATILWVVSLLTGFCTALLTVVLNNYVRG